MTLLLTLLLSALSMVALGAVATGDGDAAPGPDGGTGDGTPSPGTGPAADPPPDPGGSRHDRRSYGADDIERIVQDRLKKLSARNAELEARLKEAEPAVKRLSEIEDAQKSEIDKAREQRDNALAAAKAADEAAKQRIAEATTRYEQRVIGEAILESATEMKLSGTKVLKRDLLRDGRLKVDQDETVFAEDPGTGQRIAVKAYIEAYLKSLGEDDVFSPRPPQGSGGRAGHPASGGADTNKLTPAEKIDLGYRKAASGTR